MASSRSTHTWNFFRSGGLDQVALTTAADLQALDQLDQKLWVALSCPVKGLELDEKTLALIDVDGDGRIRVPELLTAIKWASAHLKDAGDLLKDADSLPLSAFNDATPEGKAVLRLRETDPRQPRPSRDRAHRARRCRRHREDFRRHAVQRRRRHHREIDRRCRARPTDRRHHRDQGLRCRPQRRRGHRPGSHRRVLRRLRRVFRVERRRHRAGRLAVRRRHRRRARRREGHPRQGRRLFFPLPPRRLRSRGRLPP
jgi:hypothetical protein